MKIKNQESKIKVIFHLAFLFLIFNFSSAHAWQLPIEVATYTDKGDKIYNKLVAGVESGATDGFDNFWDTPALVTSPDPENKPMLSAYFIPSPLTGEGKGGGVNLQLWKDIRGSVNGSSTWNLAVDSVPDGKKVVLSWVVPQGILKPGDRLVLKDNDKSGADGQPVQTDFTQASSYEFVSGGEAPRSLSLVLSKEPSKTSNSGGGSGFGCGTVRVDTDASPGGWASAMGVVVLFSPLVFLRLTFLRSYLYNHFH